MSKKYKIGLDAHRGIVQIDDKRVRHALVVIKVKDVVVVQKRLLRLHGVHMNGPGFLSGLVVITGNELI